MVLYPEKPHQVRTGPAAAEVACAPTPPAELAVAPGRQVRKRAVGRVVVLDVEGPAGGVVDDVDRAIRLALADEPRAVVCDLSALPDGGATGALGVLASAGRLVQDWAGIPVVIACPQAHVRDSLSAQPGAEHLVVTASVPLALAAVLETSAPIMASLRLAPHPTAPRASRDFVSRILRDWQLDHLAANACLLATELVTNAIVHAGTDIYLSLAVYGPALRLTVRDRSASLPIQREAHRDLGGHGLAIVGLLSRAWGVLPTADAGKVVWAVLDTRPGPSAKADAVS